MNNTLVCCTGLSKIYGAVRALDSIDLTLSLIDCIRRKEA